jgi:phasin
MLQRSNFMPIFRAAALDTRSSPLQGKHQRSWRDAMNETFDPAQEAKKAFEKGQEQFEKNRADFEAMARNTAVPEAFRAIAEKTVNQSREAYDRAKVAMEDSVEAMEVSADKASKGAMELNRKLIEITQANMNSSFDFAKEIAGAHNLMQVFEIQSAFARAQFETFSHQMSDLRNLSTKVATETAEPLKAQVTKTFEKARETS